MKKLFMAVAACLMMAGSSDASVTETISLAGNGGLLGTSLLINSAPITDNGVTFTAQFQVTGSDVSGAPAPANLQQTVDGLGIAGNGTDGINADDELTITFAGFTSVSGGSVAFDGFSGFELTGVDIAGEIAVLNGQTIPNNGPFNFTPLPSFQLTGQDNFFNSAADSNFRVLTFNSTFTGTAAVPEPSSLAALAFMGVCVVTRRRRR